MSGVTYLLGADLGFGSLKSTLIKPDGQVVASAAYPLSARHPHPGWSEQDPDEWYTAFCQTVRQVLSDSGVTPEKITAVAVTAGTHTTVLTDQNNSILRPAILWNDQRSGEEAAWLAQHHGPEILRIGFQKVSPTWTLSQFLWLTRHEPDTVAKVRKVFSAKDFLRHRLTGDWVTDRIDALGMLLIDAETCTWSETLCDMAGWPMNTLPPIVEATDQTGEVTAQAANDSGLAAGTPVYAGTSDTAAELFGAGAVEPGQGLVKLATAGTVSVMTDQACPDPTLINYYHVVPDHWYVITATNSCASAHKWLRDILFGREEDRKDGFSVLDSEAGEIGIGADGLLFHPYLLGERSPYWDPKLRADFVGLTLRHGRGHMIRAVYEGIAYSLLDCHQALTHSGLNMSNVRIVGGGARSALWRQIVADVLGLDLMSPDEADASFGAALIAGIGAGVFADESDAVKQAVRINSTTLFDPIAHDRYGKLFAIYKQVKEVLTPVNHELGRMFAHVE